jgi:hypothetical protein
MSIKRTLFLLTSVLGIAVFMASCTKNESTQPSQDFSYTEEFDTLVKVTGRGWVITNNSKPLGTVSWIQGFNYISMYHGLTPGKTGGPFNYLYGTGLSGNPSASGTDFLMTTSECGSGVAYCSNWLISPEITMKNGDIIKFYTRTYDNPAVGADRLQVRLNTVNSSADVGRDTTTVGNFTNLLLDINPELKLQGTGSYPGDWQQYSVVVSGMPIAKKARLGFRYLVPNGGPQGANGLGVGIDKFEFISVFN